MHPLLEAGIIILVVDPSTKFLFGKHERKYIQLAVKKGMCKWNNKCVNKSGLYVVKLILWSVISTGKYLADRYSGMSWLKLVSERFHRNSPVPRWLSSQ